MKRMIPLVMISTLSLAVAGAGCRSNDGARPDSSVAKEIVLAARQRDSLDSVSAVESRRLPPPPKAAYRSDDDPPYGRRTSSAGEVRHDPTPSRSEGAVVKHTQRDAAIGAAAGAVIGATASRSKVKGGLMGAAVGGIVGAVIGNNVDKTKKP
jgi:Glycine zipper